MKLTKEIRREQAQLRRDEIVQRLELNAKKSGELVEFLGADEFEASLAATDILLKRGSETLDALLAGIRHSNGRIRASCALLMDHLGDDRCSESLCEALKGDPLEAVRRCALHSLACQACKATPLTCDLIEPILNAALSDRSKQVRRRALQYLVGQPPDARVVEVMNRILRTDRDDTILLRAERALEWHRPSLIQNGIGSDAHSHAPTQS